VGLGVGIDLVDPEEVSASLAAHGERYLTRVFTKAEQCDCGSDPHRLAAHFAAKEATLKALGWYEEPLPWPSIGVVRDDRGRASIRLSGPAAELAERRGVRCIEVSFTYRRSIAAAVVLAEIDER
jgi:holo-[acyl-carrier protein] synthase